MKRTLSLSIALSITIALATLLVSGRANAEIVKVTVRAEVNSPFLVVHPPHPIAEPSRITVEMVEPEGPRFVRIVGHRHDRFVFVGRPYAPRYWVRTRIVEPRFIVRAPERRIFVRGPEPRVVVRAPSPRVIVRAPSPPSVVIGGPSVHIGGPRVHVGGHVGGHGRHRGRF